MKALIGALALTIFCSASLAHSKKDKKRTIVVSVCASIILAIAGSTSYYYYKTQKNERIATAQLLIPLDQPEKYAEDLYYQTIFKALTDGANPNNKLKNGIPPSINNVSATELAVRQPFPIYVYELLLMHGAYFTQEDIKKAKTDEISNFLNRWSQAPNRTLRELRRKHAAQAAKTSLSQKENSGFTFGNKKAFSFQKATGKSAKKFSLGSLESKKSSSLQLLQLTSSEDSGMPFTPTQSHDNPIFTADNSLPNTTHITYHDSEEPDSPGSNVSVQLVAIANPNKSN